MFSTVKASVISWIGIAGGVLTLLANVQKVFTLADWAHWLTNAWSTYVFGFWRSIFGLFRIHVDPAATMMVAMSVFIILIALGTHLANRIKPGGEQWSVGWQNIRLHYALLALGFYLVSYFGGNLLLSSSLIQDFSSSTSGQLILLVLLLALIGVYVAAVLLVLHSWPRSAAVTTAVAALILNQLFYNGSAQLAADPLASPILSSVVVFLFSVATALVVVYLAPPRAFAHRLVYLFIGLTLLLILNEVAKLGVIVPEPGVSPTSPGSGG